MRGFLFVTAMVCSLAAFAGLEEDVGTLQTEWARIKYQRPAAEQEKAFAELTKTADAVRGKYAGRAEPQIWYGIIAASYAGARGGLGALSLAKDAKRRSSRRSTSTRRRSTAPPTRAWAPVLPGAGLADRLRQRRESARASRQGARPQPRRHRPELLPGRFPVPQRRRGRARGTRQGAQGAATAGRALADEGRRKEIETLLAAMR